MTKRQPQINLDLMLLILTVLLCFKCMRQYIYIYIKICITRIIIISERIQIHPQRTLNGEGKHFTCRVYRESNAPHLALPPTWSSPPHQRMAPTAHTLEP